MKIEPFTRIEHIVVKMNGKSDQGGLPIPEGHGQFLADVTQGHVKQLGQRLIAGKRTPVLNQRPQAHGDRLDSVGHIDDRGECIGQEAHRRRFAQKKLLAELEGELKALTQAPIRRQQRPLGSDA